jgi:membrane protein
LSERGRAARLAGKAAVRVVPWLVMAAMAALWPRRRPDDEDSPASPEAYAKREPNRGRDAPAPWMIPPLGWKDVVWRTYRGAMTDRLPALAAGVTFYILLAVFPGIAAFVSIYGLFLNPAGVEHRVAQLAEVFPQDAMDLIGAQLRRLAMQKRGALGATFAFTTLVTLWSANAGMKALFDGLNIVYHEGEKRYYLHRSLITYLATATGIVFVAGVIGMTVVAPLVLRALGLPPFGFWRGPLHWIVVAVAAAVVFGLAYRVGPSRRPPRWRWVIVGGCFSAALWLLGSLAFSFYVSRFTHFGVTYGSLGAMIALMLWIWISVWLFLLGGELNAQLEHQTACDTTIGPDAPLGRRGAAMADAVGKAFTVGWREAWEIATAFLGRQVGYVRKFLRL